ncbi:MAG: hypothetical protein WCJ96_03545 [Verrucomicrobiota bacterium]|jgi:hypothetical protein
MSEPTPAKLPEELCALIEHLRLLQEKRGNCPMNARAALWLRLGGDSLDISPSNFHAALAEALTNAGLVSKDKTENVTALLYCLGVTNSNNLFQKVHQGKLIPYGIGKNGRRNAKGKK